MEFKDKHPLCDKNGLSENFITAHAHKGGWLYFIEAAAVEEVLSHIEMLLKSFEISKEEE